MVAADVNPNAALSAADNARANGYGAISAVCSNLLSAVAPCPLFDVILSSPPKHAGEPRDLADRGWHAGPSYRDVAALFEQARTRLKSNGEIYFEKEIGQCGYHLYKSRGIRSGPGVVPTHKD